ncbi:hypothetical protein IC614_09195 [Allosphingosinicella flava]|uniref:Uncharacterized protein n=1 Tax=Allosphingosinicella flava TaxID=2771430 RepID=A0A7T2GIJ1_9SPHN|nr:hypothetical protein [Sphingosinicella flava]QPQ54508.1 hypothetical protein IC614_09195 [Sphingosinicella flava]
MRPIRLSVAAALIVALPAHAIANPASALSIARAGPVLEAESGLTRGELYPLIGLAALAVLVLALANEKVEGEGPISA